MFKEIKSLAARSFLAATAAAVASPAIAEEFSCEFPNSGTRLLVAALDDAAMVASAENRQTNDHYARMALAWQFKELPERNDFYQNLTEERHPVEWAALQQAGRKIQRIYDDNSALSPVVKATIREILADTLINNIQDPELLARTQARIRDPLSDNRYKTEDGFVCLSTDLTKTNQPVLE